MTDNRLSQFCLVNGETTSNAFSIKIPSNDPVDDLKKLIKAENQLTHWRVSIPDEDDNDLPVLLDSVPEKKKLKATTRLLKVFDTELPDDTIHIIVPPQVNAPVPSRALTPLPGYLSDGSRPSTPLSGDLHADIKRITDKFFAPGPIADFLGAFVRGEKKLPVTKGSIRGLPSAWRRGFGKAPETLRGFVLYLDVKLDPVPAGMSRLQGVA
ncbi:hypothetical protein KI688_003183 [Linnemannia hyalina]|uniref:Crinkler effector protein N-terminal domain-containing protein n=1 Tax=Linnemannia hyalina TaxID=64524 RepID=A0A9P7XSI3_9FUNG|nr:hypothetical protein KI688_003183 [Linnemannia hyalina]